MDDWRKFNETSPPKNPLPPPQKKKKKKKIYSHLNMEDITDADCVHAERSL